MFIVIFVLLKTWRLPHVYIMVVSFGTSFPLGSLFYRSGISKMHVEHPQKKVSFLAGFAFRHNASDSVPSLQFADRLCSDITHTHT